MPKSKAKLDCPLCRCIMRRHPAGYFLCPECKSMFSLYGGPEMAETIRLKLAALEARQQPQTHEQAIRQRVDARKVRPSAWTVYTFKKDGQEGFLCFCEQFKPFDSYVYAHWNERVTHACETCKSKFAIQGGKVTVLKNPCKEFSK